MFFPSSFIFVHFLSSDMLNFSHLSFDVFFQFMFRVCSTFVLVFIVHVITLWSDVFKPFIGYTPHLRLTHVVYHRDLG